MAQNGAPTYEIERQGRWKQGGGMVGRYTRGESAESALRYLRLTSFQPRVVKPCRIRHMSRY